MKNKALKAAVIAAVATLLPAFSYADTGVAADLHSMQGMLDQLYDQMMPLCSQLIDVARGIAGLGALLFIAMRVWRHIAAAEPIDMYPLLRPFALGLCIAAFPAFMSLLNGALKPTVTATAAMVGNGNAVIVNLTDDDPANDPPPITSGSNSDKWYQYSHPDNSNSSSSNISDMFSGWSFRSMMQRWVKDFLTVCFEAAALCIDTIRTFKLIVLSILGPLCFGLSVFEGFQHTLRNWIARYINVYMWLPVANIFGAIIAKIQANMIQLQHSGAASNASFANGNTVYMIFLLIAIVGYFTVPSIANYIVNTGGHALLSKTSSLASTATSFTTGRVYQGLQDIKRLFDKTNSDTKGSGGSGNSGHMADKISGKS